MCGSIKPWLLVCMTGCGCVTLAACGDMASRGSSVYREGLMTPSGEPAYITVQHCLIGFEGSVPSKNIMRKKDEAERLAQEWFGKAQAGEDFAKIVVAHTDDSPPGIYRMANDGFPGDMTQRNPNKQVYPRGSMVPGFGDVGFKLKVDEIGLIPYDPTTSPFGWHIVKRIK